MNIIRDKIKHKDWEIRKGKKQGVYYLDIMLIVSKNYSYLLIM